MNGALLYCTLLACSDNEDSTKHFFLLLLQSLAFCQWHTRSSVWTEKDYNAIMSRANMWPRSKSLGYYPETEHLNTGLKKESSSRILSKSNQFVLHLRRAQVQLKYWPSESDKGVHAQMNTTYWDLRWNSVAHSHQLCQQLVKLSSSNPKGTFQAHRCWGGNLNFLLVWTQGGCWDINREEKPRNFSCRNSKTIAFSPFPWFCRSRFNASAFPLILKASFTAASWFPVSIHHFMSHTKKKMKFCNVICQW